MSSATLLAIGPQGLAPGRPYAERDERETPWHDRLALGLWHGAAMPLVGATGLRQRHARKLVGLVDAMAGEVAALDDGGLRAEAQRLRVRLRRCAFGRPLTTAPTRSPKKP